MAQNSYIVIMQSLVEIERHRLVWEDTVWCFSLFFFICHAEQFRSAVVGLLQQEIASVGLFVGRFRYGLQRFFRTWNALSLCRITHWKFVASWRHHRPTKSNARKKIGKIRENGCKVYAHHFGNLEANRKKIPQQHFTSFNVDVHPCKMFRYLF